MVEVLNGEHLAGAVLDVTVPEPLPVQHPLRHEKNVLITPHVAGIPFLKQAVDQVVSLFCEDFGNCVEGRPLKRRVDRKTGY